jgi:hypothetical protein
MNRFAFRFVFVALNAFGGINVLVQWNGMNRGKGPRRQQSDQGKANPDGFSWLASAAAGGRFAETDAMREEFHTASEGGMLHDCRRNAKRWPRVATCS